MKEAKRYAFALYTVMFIVNLFLMFFLTRHNGAFKGHMVPWVVAIGMTPIGLMLLMPPVKIKTWDFNKIMFFGTLVVLNLIMALFSILDIVGEKHYGVSSILFVVVPAVTLLQHGLRHIKI